MNKINNLRSIIDIIDDQIFELIKKRLDVVKEIGEIKRQEAIEVQDTKREQIIYDRLVEKAIEKNIDPAAVKNIWKALIQAAYDVEGVKNGNR